MTAPQTIPVAGPLDAAPVFPGSELTGLAWEGKFLDDSYGQSIRWRATGGDEEHPRRFKLDVFSGVWYAEIEDQTPAAPPDYVTRQARLLSFQTRDQQAALAWLASQTERGWNPL